MRVLIVLCHPDPESLNAAIARRCRKHAEDAGHTVTLLDLYSEYRGRQFNPVLELEEIRRRFSFDETAQRYSKELLGATALIFVHPDWWGMPPALLKGWLDRILRPGIAYDYDAPEFLTKRRVPLLGGKRSMVICTTDAEEEDLPQHPLEFIWRNAILGYCGVNEVRFHLLWNVHKSTRRERKRWMDMVVRDAMELFEEEV